MDQSLAKGLKNELFREVEKGAELARNKFVVVTQNSRATAKRSHWDSYVTNTRKAFGEYLLASHSGGSKRKPYLVLSTLDVNNSKQFNTWNESCLESTQLLINFDPWHVEACPTGFNVSDHAIQRIYQRNYNSDDITQTKSRTALILKELTYAPLWCPYWTQAAFAIFIENKVTKIYPLIPTPRGMLLGEMTQDKIHKVEIRTYVNDDALSKSQQVLKNKMMDITNIFKDSNLAFFPILDTTNIESTESESKKFHAALEDFNNLLKEEILPK